MIKEEDSGLVNGLLIVVSGFSGSGKSTLTRLLVQRYDCYALSVSATTRAPRDGEEEGTAYFFKTEEEFLDMIARDEFLEHAQYVSNRYGTPRAYVDAQLEAGRDVLLEIDIQGAMQVKAKRPDTLMLFVTPPSAGELEKRLRARGTEEESVICSRLQRAVEESDGMEAYEYILINDDLERCVEETHALIRAQHRHTQHQSAFIEEMRAELRKREELLR